MNLINPRFTETMFQFVFPIVYRTVTPQQWLAHSKYNKDKSDAEMHSSKRLRENIQQTMAQSKSDLDSQKNATEYAMRKRIHETEQAHDELCWQRKNVQFTRLIAILVFGADQTYLPKETQFFSGNLGLCFVFGYLSNKKKYLKLVVHIAKLFNEKETRQLYLFLIFIFF